MSPYTGGHAADEMRPPMQVPSAAMLQSRPDPAHRHGGPGAGWYRPGPDGWLRVTDADAANERYTDMRHFMTDPRTVTGMAPDPVIELVTRAYSAAGPQERAGRWVMSRPWYDRLRAATWTEDQERARAREHAAIWISTDGPPPGCCPVCMAGPFADMKAFTGHVAAQADPANREPDPRDRLFGFQIEVREDGGEPHLASPHPASPFGLRPWVRTTAP